MHAVRDCLTTNPCHLDNLRLSTGCETEIPQAGRVVSWAWFNVWAMNLFESFAHALAAGAIDGVILTAPSTVRALADGLVRAPSPALAAIGEPTHTAVVALGLEAVVAESTVPSGLVEALERAVAAPPGRRRPAPPQDIAPSAQEE